MCGWIKRYFFPPEKIGMINFGLGSLYYVSSKENLTYPMLKAMFFQQNKAQARLSSS